MNSVESGFYLQAPAAAVTQLDSRVWRRRRIHRGFLFLCLHRHSHKRRRLALQKALLPLIKLPGAHIVRAAICRYALSTCLLRGYQLTPSLTNYFSVITHDSRMQPTSCSLKMGFTQRSPPFPPRSKRFPAQSAANSHLIKSRTAALDASNND